MSRPAAYAAGVSAPPFIDTYLPRVSLVRIRLTPRTITDGRQIAGSAPSDDPPRRVRGQPRNRPVAAGVAAPSFHRRCRGPAGLFYSRSRRSRRFEKQLPALWASVRAETRPRCVSGITPPRAAADRARRGPPLGSHCPAVGGGDYPCSKAHSEYRTCFRIGQGRTPSMIKAFPRALCMSWQSSSQYPPQRTPRTSGANP